MEPASFIVAFTREQYSYAFRESRIQTTAFYPKFLRPISLLPMLIKIQPDTVYKYLHTVASGWIFINIELRCTEP